MAYRTRCFQVAFLAVAYAASVSTVGATDISGTISTTTWTAANSPYRVIDTVTIPSGETLTVEAGVDVLFDADVQFIVEGAIHVYGTESDSVRFLNGAADMWRGIRISGGDSSSFAFTRISGGNARATENQRGGGIGVLDTATRLYMTNSVVAGNSAEVYGGGLWNFYATTRLEKCVIAWNTGQSGGGGISNSVGTVILTNCTVANNFASASGGGSMNFSDGVMVVTNSIYWANQGVQVYRSGGSVTTVYCDIQGGRTGTGNIDADPLFQNPNEGDYRLRTGSPCINKGDPASPLDPDGTRADIGAFYKTNYGDASGDGTVTAYDASVVLLYVVRTLGEINQLTADVTGNGVVSSYDASHILARSIYPDYVFPVETNSPGKPAVLPVVAWAQDDDLWELRSDATSPYGITLELRMVVGTEVHSSALLASSRDGEIVRVAVAGMGNETAILRVRGEYPPIVVSATFNEMPISIATPISFSLAQNAPNPFNPVTSLRFSIPEACEVLLAVYDVSGRLVRTLISSELAAGLHEVMWDARDDAGRAVASGVYVYRLTAGTDVAVRRMTLVR